MSQSRTKCHIIFLTKFEAVCFCCCSSLQQTMTILKSSDVILFNSDSPQNSGKTGVVNSQRKLLHAVVVGVTRNKTLILLLAFISEKIGPGQFFYSFTNRFKFRDLFVFFLLSCRRYIRLYYYYYQGVRVIDQLIISGN